MRIISRNVWVLSIVSLFTDVASEMLYPVMPVYLRSIGFSILLIGVLEGIAEAIAGLSKGYFGKLSDLKGSRLPFIRTGYALSAVSKPLMAVFIYPLWIVLVRALDRLGKGVRTAARDALLSDEATPATKARVFGVHRAMDTLGAVLGPLSALIYLAYFPGNYKQLFFIAFIPGVLAYVCTWFIHEKKKNVTVKERGSLFLFARYWKESPPNYRRLAGALLLFTLFNSSDVFLLLRMKEAGFSDSSVISAYIFYNLVYAAFSYPLGILADRLGMKKIFIGGMLLFALVYFLMSFQQSRMVYYFIFLVYGVYAAATEGVAKAWISNICEKKDTATAIGTYTAFQSLATLIASSGAGLLWFTFGPGAVFISSAVVAILVALYVSRIREQAIVT